MRDGSARHCHGALGVGEADEVADGREEQGVASFCPSTVAVISICDTSTSTR